MIDTNSNFFNLYSSPSFQNTFLGDDLYSTQIAAYQRLLINQNLSIFMPSFGNLSAQDFSSTNVPSNTSTNKKCNGNFSQESTQKINEISARLNCNPEDLKAIIMSESDGKASAVNHQSGATGLIQFLPSTAKWLGTSIQELKQMSAEDQLYYVEKYLTAMKKSAGYSQSDKLDANTLYCLVFSPAKAKKQSQDALYSKGSLAYAQNIGLDSNHDGKITKAELGQRMTQYVA